MNRFLPFLLLLVISVSLQAQTYYVDASAAGLNDGSSWTNAFTTLSAAITQANGNSQITAIRIARGGSYTGLEYTISRSYSISGGWDKTSNVQSTDQASSSILDGLQQHRILKISAGSTVVLSGLSLTNGGNIAANGGAITNSGVLTVSYCYFTNNTVIPQQPNNATGDAIANGAAIYSDGTLAVSNCLFQGNNSANSGGAITNKNGSLTVTGSSFLNNYATYDGGAIANFGVSSAVLKVSYSRFSGNTLLQQGTSSNSWVVNGMGGAIKHEGKSADIVNCILDNNKAMSGGAIYAIGTLTVRNNTFYANTAYNTTVHYYGGGITLDYLGSRTFSAYIYNNIFTGNSSPTYGASITSFANNADIQNNLYESGSIYNQTGTTANNISGTPSMVNPAGGDFSLNAGSAGIDGGNNDYYSNLGYPGYDYKNQLRISPCTIDMGAIEYQQPALNGIKPDNNGVLYVDAGSSYNVSGDKGSSWSKALSSVGTAIDYANNCASVIEIHVAGGTYLQNTSQLSRAYSIKGGYDVSTGSQDWKANPTIVTGVSGSPILDITAAGSNAVLLEGLVFDGATATGNGGAIHNSAQLQLAWCIFSNNQAAYGGGVYNESDGNVKLIDCSFFKNKSTVGSSVYNLGRLTIDNCSIGNNVTDASNLSKTASTIYNLAAMTIRNSIVWGNVEGVIHNDGTLSLDHNIIRNFSTGTWGWGGGTVTHVTDSATDQRNSDPLFTDAVNGDLSLQANSPAMNSGSNVLYQRAVDSIGTAEDLSVDLAVNSRIYGASIDLGAYERQMTPQVLTFSSPLTAVYGDAPMATGVTSGSGSGLSIEYTSANNQIASVFQDGDGLWKIRINGAGTVNILAVQTGNETYDPSMTDTIVLTVTPRAVTVTADAKTKTYGDPDPVFTYTATPALVTGDAFSGALSRDAGEDVGSYAITEGSLANANYTITYVSDSLRIGKADQQISWTQSLLSNCDGSTGITLTATSSSGLSVSYQSADAAVATVSNDLLTVVSPGIVVITASQAGDGNYNPATAVTNTLISRLPAYLQSVHWNDVIMYDNSSLQYTGWQWYKNDMAVSGATGQYYTESPSLNGVYYAQVKTVAGLSLPTCPITVSGSGVTTPISVYPNPVKPGQTVTLKTGYTSAQLQGASVIVSNSMGVVQQTIQTVQPQTSIQMSAAQGIYIVRLILSSGTFHSVNVLVMP